MAYQTQVLKAAYRWCRAGYHDRTVDGVAGLHADVQVAIQAVVHLELETHRTADRSPQELGICSSVGQP